MTEEKLWMMFKHFDLDDQNFISKQNIEEAMGKLGKKITQMEIEETLCIHDSQKSGKITFNDFRQMFIHEIQEEASEEIDEMFNDNQ